MTDIDYSNTSIIHPTPHASANIKAKVSAAFDRAATTYEARAQFQHRVCERLFSSLQSVRPKVAVSAGLRILDGGCGTGYGASLLRQYWPDAEIIACDLAPEMVRQTQARGVTAVCGDLERLPFADASFDVIWSSLALQWCDLSSAFSEFERVLTHGGILIFTTLGQNTLHELATAFGGDDGVGDGHRHILPFVSGTHLEGVLSDAGFARTSISCEDWMTRHSDFSSLLATIRGIGANQVGANRRRSLMGKTAWQSAKVRYEQVRGADGMLPLTYEVMLGWAEKR